MNQPTEKENQMTNTEKPNVPFTRERFYLEHVGGHGIPSLRRHINRYKWAASAIYPGAKVLDAGSGSGYGDHILMTKASKVVGVEVSAEAINYARWKAEEVHQPNIEYVQADLRTFDLGDAKFDAAVCIEVIEHVGAEDQNKIMERIKAHLEPNGWLMITTPVKKEGMLMTEFHEHEFSTEEFKKFLGNHFSATSFDDPAKFGIPPDFLLAVCQVPLS